MKCFLLIAFFISFSNLATAASFNSKFECSLPTTKRIVLEASDFDWKDLGYDSLDEFSSELNNLADEELTGMNDEELALLRIYRSAELVIESTVDYVKSYKWNDEERFQLLSENLNKPVSLSILNVYKNDTSFEAKVGDEVFINLDSRLLFDYGMSISLQKLRKGYVNYSIQEAIEKSGKAEIESFYSRARSAAVVSFATVNRGQPLVCGNDYLLDGGKYLFFLKIDNEKQLELLLGFSVFDTKHKNILDVLIEE